MKKTYLTLLLVLAMAGFATAQNVGKDNDISWSVLKTEKDVTISMAKTLCGNTKLVLVRFENKSTEQRNVSFEIPTGVLNQNMVTSSILLESNQIVSGSCTANQNYTLTWVYNEFPKALEIKSTIN